MRIDVLTLFPDMFTGVLASSILKRAADKNLVSYHLHQLREYSKDVHKKVDDTPYGGGPGLVLMCQPVMDAVAAIESQSNVSPHRIMLCPTGQKLTQDLAADLANRPRLLLIAGHYEGFDDRISQFLQPQKISIGDYVLSGGELPAMVLIDTVVRLIPGVLGDELSHHGESFSKQDTVIEGGLEYPQYTRPREYQGLQVPDVLLSGNHAMIEAWRKEQSQKITAERRPDLMKDKKFTTETRRHGEDQK